MPVDVSITKDAAAFRDAMDRRHRKRYDDWLLELRSQGCGAMGYRMYGEFVGIKPPVGERTKPACCDGEGLPPAGSGVMDELANRMREVAKSTPRRGGRRH